MKLTEAIDLYVLALNEKRFSKAHTDSVAWRLGHFAKGREDRLLGSVTRLELSTYFQEAGETRADGTIAGMISTHKAFWKWCKKRGLVTKNLANKLKRPRFDPVARTAAPAADIVTVIQSLPRFVGHRDLNPRDLRDALAVSLSIDSGCRLGALAELRRSDAQRALQRPIVADNGRAMYQVMARNKTGAALLEFSEETAQLLQDWLAICPATAVDRVFISLAGPTGSAGGRALRRDSLARSFERVCKFAGVPVFRAHAVRKRNISELLAVADPEVAQRYAGHSDLNTTLIHYKEKGGEQVTEAAASLASKRRGDQEFDQAVAQLFGVDKAVMSR